MKLKLNTFNKVSLISFSIYIFVALYFFIFFVDANNLFYISDVIIERLLMACMLVFSGSLLNVLCVPLLCFVSFAFMFFWVLDVISIIYMIKIIKWNIKPIQFSLKHYVILIANINFWVLINIILSSLIELEDMIVNPGILLIVDAHPIFSLFQMFTLIVLLLLSAIVYFSLIIGVLKLSKFNKFSLILFLIYALILHYVHFSGFSLQVEPSNLFDGPYPFVIDYFLHSLVMVVYGSLFNISVMALSGSLASFIYWPLIILDVISIIYMIKIIKWNLKPKDYTLKHYITVIVTISYWTSVNLTLMF